ncbi:class I SAM-dependent methyltransferase [Sphingomonas psychrotolerans]|uniref:class I SAM-dependent methyltransferase n=1 Tax=Sphingomonas psychrotolerans TaxID=1327635 RepID=UPI0013051AC0|nr:class I SAM-dependent methyltransferase [Sphingomonas psychrotolerans]
MWQCLGCSLWYRAPSLSKAQLDKLYDTGTAEAWETPLEERVDWSLAKSALPESGKILDLGCYDGRFLESIGERWDRYGIEVNRAAATRAGESGVKIVGHDFTALADNPASFDAITAFDIFEHVSDPLALLHACSESLRPGGKLIVATGNTDSFPFRLLKSRNAYCICAEHLVFLNPSWCDAAAGKTGLIVESIVRYRRATGGPARRALDSLKNVLFIAAPWLISSLRRIRGKVSHEEKLGYPVLWPTAMDHFLVQFTRETE